MLIQNILSFDDFKTYLDNYKGVIINISAEWCKPCAIIKPQIEKFISVIENSDVIYLKLDNSIYDEDYRFDSFFNLKKIPYFAFISQNQIIESFISADFMYVSKKIHGFQSKFTEISFKEDF